MNDRRPASSLESPDWTIRSARLEDFAGAALLLETAGLPLDQLDKQFGEAYVLAFRDGRLEGMAGLEVYGRYGFLRSVVVDAGLRKAGLGHRLVEDRIGRARILGLDALYLLTTSAAEYFERLDFRKIPRSEAPAAILESSQFTTACPDSAVLMRLSLSD